MTARRRASLYAFGAAVAVGGGLAGGAPGLELERLHAGAQHWMAWPLGERSGAHAELRRWPPGTWRAEAEQLAEAEEASCDAPRAFSVPSGEPPRLGCDDARAVVAQARASLAVPAEPIDEARFALITSDWLDPHGLWSVAPDSPVGPILRARASALLKELEAPARSGPCTAALEIGASLSAWSTELRQLAIESRTAPQHAPIVRPKAWDSVSSTPFEDGRVTRPGRELARLLGRSAGAAEAAYGAAIARHADALFERSLPEKSAEGWAEVVLAAAVRAYVPQIDPHGAWAPVDEETSIYDLDLEVDPPPRLWSDMTRTALGIRIDRGARPPLHDGDVVLSVGPLALAGMSVEQLTQVAVLDEQWRAAERPPVEVELLRAGASEPVRRWIGADLALDGPEPAQPELELQTSSVSFGNGRVLVVRIPDVPDDLGDRVADVVSRARESDPPVGILLDLRGNGGGSTDGALSTLGLFLPGAALFPMRRRGGDIEIDRAPTPAPEQAWSGPVAALVDGDSASAAEMIAGALASYRRGPVLGSRTYGKGCAQEYLDDDAKRGVLRLTTLVFSLPDGSPLQRVGVVPQVMLGPQLASEREELLPRAPLAWRGPDVRDAHLVREVPWPNSGGRVGQASDPTIARALRAIGTTRAASR